MAALVWWFISLNRQNDMMKDLALQNGQDPKKVMTKHRTNKSKYLGEGSIFFLLIVVGAAFVYRSVRKQFLLQQQQQNFMMAVTHELKTPISVARLNLETLQKYTLDPEKQNKLIRNALDETERLNFLTNNILISSQMETRGYQSSKEELDLSDLFKDCIQNFRNRFPDRKISEMVESEAVIRGDALLLQILINNLLENAIKYSPKDGVIKACLGRKGSAIELVVADAGPGIPDEEKHRIFTKFYRIGNESTRKKQGTGLGLYLSRRIAKNHNGDISVTNNESGGSNFTVIFHT